MKKFAISFVLLILLAMTVLLSCGSPEERARREEERLNLELSKIRENNTDEKLISKFTQFGSNVTFYDADAKEIKGSIFIKKGQYALKQNQSSYFRDADGIYGWNNRDKYYFYKQTVGENALEKAMAEELPVTMIFNNEIEKVISQEKTKDGKVLVTTEVGIDDFWYDCLLHTYGHPVSRTDTIRMEYVVSKEDYIWMSSSGTWLQKGSEQEVPLFTASRNPSLEYSGARAMKQTILYNSDYRIINWYDIGGDADQFRDWENYDPDFDGKMRVARGVWVSFILSDEYDGLVYEDKECTKEWRDRDWNAAITVYLKRKPSAEAEVSP